MSLRSVMKDGIVFTKISDEGAADLLAKEMNSTGGIVEFNKIYAEFIDLSECDHENAYIQDIAKLLELLEGAFDIFEKSFVAVYVVSLYHVFGSIGMMKHYARSSKNLALVETFHDKDEAVTWLEKCIKKERRL
jgi:hypothetical protein